MAEDVSAIVAALDDIPVRRRHLWECVDDLPPRRERLGAAVLPALLRGWHRGSAATRAEAGAEAVRWAEARGAALDRVPEAKED